MALTGEACQRRETISLAGQRAAVALVVLSWEN